MEDAEGENMATSSQIRQKIAEIIKKRSKVDQDMSTAERKKATKEAEAASKEARASRASSRATQRQYLRQADSARKAAINEGKSIADLAKKRASLAKDESALNAALTAALKREAANEKREADKREARYRDDERKRQQDLLRAEKQRRADREETYARLEEAEERLTSQIRALNEPKPEKLRVLYATATPEGGLRVSQEIKRVKKAVLSALHRDLVNIEHAPDVTKEDLLDWLTSFQPHVVHFSGHATEDILVFDDGTVEGGEGSEIPIDLFMRAVSTPDRPPALVVLNACKSAANLETLLAGVPIAIGMSSSIGDTDAITFATRFYRAIADGQSVESALAVARVDMEMNGLSDHDLPTIVTAPGVDASTARLVVAPPNESSAG